MFYRLSWKKSPGCLFSHKKRGAVTTTKTNVWRRVLPRSNQVDDHLWLLPKTNINLCKTDTQSFRTWLERLPPSQAWWVLRGSKGFWHLYFPFSFKKHIFTNFLMNKTTKTTQKNLSNQSFFEIYELSIYIYFHFSAIYTMVSIVASYLICNTLHLILTVLERYVKSFLYYTHNKPIRKRSLLFLSSDSDLLKDPNDPGLASTFHTRFSDIVSFVYMFTSAMRLLIHYFCNSTIRSDINGYFCKSSSNEVPEEAELWHKHSFSLLFRLNFIFNSTENFHTSLIWIECAIKAGILIINKTNSWFFEFTFICTYKKFTWFCGVNINAWTGMCHGTKWWQW